MYNNRSALVLSSHVDADNLFKSDSTSEYDSSLLGDKENESFIRREREQQEQLQFERYYLIERSNDIVCAQIV